MSKSLMNREYTRREFMKMTAKGLAGVSLSGSMLSLLGCTLAQAEQVQLYPNAEFLLVFNPARCTGCQRCEANCTLANDGVAQPYMSRIHVRDYAQFGGKVTVDYLDGEGIFGNWSIPAETCRQCKDAPCMVGCPVKAINPDPQTGARVVDESVCVGCGLCVTNCPWHMPRLRLDTGKSTKCINCGACAAGCPTSALKMIQWEDVATAMSAGA